MKDFNEIADMLVGFLKKYGLIVAILAVIGYTLKKSWFWVALPLLLCSGLKALWPQIGAPAMGIVCLWVFVWSLLSKLLEVKT